MDISSSYTSIPNVNGLQSTSLERVATGLAINKASDDPSGLLIADALDLQKTSLVQSIENMSSGIAMGSIAQDALASQKDVLENIKTETLKAMNGTMSQDDREIIEKQISKYIDQYDQIANSATYNGTTLLNIANDSSDDLSIVAEESIIEMKKVDTKSISDQLKSFLSDFSTNPDSMKGMLESVDNGIDKLADFASDFGSSINTMESSIRYSMSTEVEISKAQSTILDIDYSKEVSSFSKTNIMAQMGMFVQSQSNAIQSRNIALLS